MVSNTLKMDLEELLEIVERLRREHVNDPEYRKLRKELPDDWPI